MPFVRAIAIETLERFNCRRDDMLDDLCAEGAVEFCERIQCGNYDESRGRLTTYLHPFLRGRMYRYMEANLGVMALSKDEMQRVRSAQQLYYDTGKSTEEIAAQLGVSENAAAKAIAYNMVCGFAKDELYSGVTTIRTVGGLGDFDTRLRDDIAAGKKPGPRILAANEGISVPGGHMAGSVAIAADSVEEALQHLETSKAQKVDLVKLMITGGVLDAKEKGVPGELKMAPEMVKAVCDKAHTMGYMVAAHVESPEGVKAALKNGVDSIEHGAKADEEMISLFKEHNAFLCTTLSPALPYALFDRSITNASEVEQFNGNVVFEGIIDCAKAAIANDIPVVLGNDVGCPWITQYDFWRELYYFHKYVGVSNAFALYTATCRGAEMAGIGDITGTLESGKCADMIVVEKNPLEDLRVLRNVDMVIAQGKVIRAPKVKKKQIVETELDKFLN